MILGFLRREFPKRLRSGERWDDAWEWTARGYTQAFLLPAGAVLTDWALCRNVAQVAAAWHVSPGFLVERLEELGAL